MLPAVAEQRLLKYEHELRDLQARLTAQLPAWSCVIARSPSKETISGQQLAELRGRYGNQVAELQARAELQERELLRTSSQVQEILNSTTWWIGGPLRWIGGPPPELSAWACAVCFAHPGDRSRGWPLQQPPLSTLCRLTFPPARGCEDVTVLGSTSTLTTAGAAASLRAGVT